MGWALRSALGGVDLGEVPWCAPISRSHPGGGTHGQLLLLYCLFLPVCTVPPHTVPAFSNGAYGPSHPFPPAPHLTQPPLSEDTGRQILSLTVHICSSHSKWGVEEFLTPLDEFRGSNSAVLLLASVTRCSSELLVAVSLGCHIFMHLAWWSWCLCLYRRWFVPNSLLFGNSVLPPKKTYLSWVN